MAASNAPKPPPTQPQVPFYGPDDVPAPQPERALPAPPKDFRTGLRDALSDDNVRYYIGPHAFEALRKLHALTQFLPGSGTVQSREDTSRANEEAQQGNYGKAAAHVAIGTLNAALDWVPSAKLAILAGMSARTFPWGRLPTAMKMETAGRSADEIWRTTGLGRTADGNWVFEISDKGYRVRPEAGEPTIYKPVTVAPLYRQLEHPGMQEAYPQLSGIESVLHIHPPVRPEGRSFPDRLEIHAPDLEAARSIGIHELQHMVDRLEGHAPGGSPNQFMRMGIPEREAWDLYQRLVGEVVARNAQHRLLMSERQRRLQSPLSTESVPRDRQINLYDE